MKPIEESANMNMSFEKMIQSKIKCKIIESNTDNMAKR